MPDTTTTAPLKHLTRRRKILPLFIFMLILLTGVAILHIFPAPYFAKRAVFASPKLDFTYLEPSKLPSGVNIYEKRIAVSPYNIRAELNFRTENWMYTISEVKYEPNDPTQDISVGNDNYNPTSIPPTCALRQSNGGERYRLCHWVEYGRISVYEIKFAKKDTFVTARMPAKVNASISSNSIDEFVDSFKAVRAARVKTLQLSPP